MNDYHLYTFPNGIRLLHKQVNNTKIAHCGFILDVGSRNEKPHQQGMAHFWEHLAFKGTTRRKAYHIINRLEAVGGELNAYTTKEKICFHASVLDSHLEKAIELLSDITFNSTFPEREIEKEKGVILEEMSMYEDDPADALQDHFDALMYPNHPLGYNILGTQQSVSGFNREGFLNFVSENLDTEHIICTTISPLPFKKVLATAEKYLPQIPTKKASPHRQKFDHYKAFELTVKKPISQAHCIIGAEAYSLYDRKRLPFFMLVNWLGGVSMTSRLNMSLREKYGLVYHIEANYTNFIDTGMFSVYFATDKNNLERCQSLSYKELKTLRDNSLSSLQLHRLKQQLKGQLAMAEESNLNLMLMMGKSILDFGRVETISEVFEQIDQTTATELLEIANEIFPEHKLSGLVYMPEK